MTFTMTFTMKNISALCILIISLTIQVKSQSDLDSTLFDLHEEYEYFKNFESSNAFDLLYLINDKDLKSKELLRNSFYDFLGELEEKLPKKEKKKAELIYESIHKKYLIRYIENPAFPDIFSKGEFNCVTATALYAISLQYFDLPYEIRELPTHVYLIVYPKTERIIFETTDPVNGLSELSEKQVEEYREYLVSNKILTRQEADNDDLLENHILPDSIISLQQLVGIQYYNNSIKSVAEEKPKKAILEMEKAHILHGGFYIEEWLNYLLILDTETLNDENPDQNCAAFAKLYNYNKETEDIIPFIAEMYFSFWEQNMKQTKKVESLMEIDNCLRQTIEEKELIKEFDLVKHLFLSQHYYESTEFDQALKSLEAIYDKNHPNLNLLIRECIVKKLNQMSNPAEALDTLRHYQNIFEFAKEDELILSAKAWCILKIALIHFELEEINDGMVYLNQFRQDFDPKMSINYPEELLGFTFGSISSHHFRKDDYKKAEELLLEGLEYNPYNLILKRKLKLLREFVDK